MARVTLPLRSQRAQPTSSESQGSAGPPMNVPRARNTRSNPDGGTSHHPNEPSNPGVSDDESELSQSAMPSIERSPSPATSTPNTGEIRSSVSPPPRSASDTSNRRQPRRSLDMTDIGDAIDGVVRGEDTRPSGSFLAVSSPGFSRRRSSPRPEPVLHSVEDEELPDDEFHHPAFTQRLSETRRTLENLARVLSSGSIHLEPDSTVKRHHEEAERLSSFRPLATRVVGLVGDSGVGKSSLINSVLDRSSLARTTGRGSACTCVVTEYHFHEAENYVIDVEMFSEDDLCEQLAELLGSYRASPGEESDKKAEIAIDTFRSMFRGKLLDENWILTEDESVVLNQFKTWAKEVRRFGSSDRRVAATLDECSSLLLQLSSEPNNPRQPSLWPYIRKIKVHLNAHILRKGLVLVDLPGLRDLNSARRNITQQYLVNCHEVFAICEIKRAITNEGVKTVFDIAQQARLERVGIICTSADEINLNEVHNDWEEEEAGPIRDLKRSLRALGREFETIKAELATFEGLPNNDAASQQAKLELFAEKMEVENRRDALEFQLLERAIRTRNSHVTHELRTEYTSLANGATLNVFCVGNKMYQDKRNLDKSVSRKYLELSGIIDVRRHLVALVGESQLRASTNFLEHQVPALLRDIDIWVQSGAGTASVEEKQAVGVVLRKVEKKLETGLTSRRSPLSSIKRCLNESFENRIWEGRQISKPNLLGMHAWIGTSGTTVLESPPHPGSALMFLDGKKILTLIGSYAAFLRNKGDHCTPAVGNHDWSQEVMKDMVTDTKSTWDDLLSDVHFYKVTLKQDVAACWEEAIALLECEWPDSNDLGDEIGQALNVRKDLLLDTVEEIFDRFNDAASFLRKDTLTSLSGSMIRRIMSCVCREALQHEGNGCTKLRKARVSRTFANDGVFHDITKELRRGFTDHVEDIQQVLVELVSTQLDATRATLDIARGENAVLENERDPEFRQRVADEVARARSLMGM